MASRGLGLLLGVMLLAALPSPAEARPAKRRGPPPKKNGILAPARSSKAPGTMIGFAAGVSYESVEIDDVEPRVSMDGYGLTAKFVFDAEVARALAAPIALGIHQTSVAGQSETVRITVSMLSILADVGLLYRVSPTLRLGAFGAYDFGVGGDVAFKTRDAGSDTQTLKSSSRMPFGARLHYNMSTGVATLLDVATVAGTLAVKPKAESAGPEANKPTDFSGMNLRFLVVYYL